MSERKGSITALLSGIAAIITAVTGVYLAYSSNSDSEPQPHSGKTIIIGDVGSNNKSFVVNPEKHIQLTNTNSVHSNLIGTWSGEVISNSAHGIERMIFQDTYYSLGEMKRVGQLSLDMPNSNNSSISAVVKIKLIMNWSIEADNIVFLVKDRELDIISLKINGVEAVSYYKEQFGFLNNFPIGQTEKMKIKQITASSLTLEIYNNLTETKQTVFMKKIAQ